MTLDIEGIQRLSPQAMRIFQKQLPLRLKQMGELERNTALEQLSHLSQFQEGVGLQPQDIAPQPQAPPDTDIWGQAWNVFTAPFQWVHEQAILPFAATITSPFTPSAGIERESGESWLAYEKRQYEQWNAPWLLKFGIETLPWFMIPGAGAVGAAGAGGRGIAGMLGRAAPALGKAAPVVRGIGKAVEYSPWGVAEKAVGVALGIAAKPVIKVAKPVIRKFIPEKLPDVARFTAPATDVLEKQLTQRDWQGRIAQWFGRKPFFRKPIEATGGRAATVTEAVEDTTARALLIAPRVQESLMSKGQVALASLRRIHPDPIKLFGVDEATGLTKIRVKAGFKGAPKHITDIAEHPNKYVLDATQKEYITQVHMVEDWVLDGLKEAGINPKLLKFDEFSHWVHREVIGKNIDDALVKIKKSWAGRIGKKASFEKTRFYETASEGVKAGVIYEPSLERVAELYIQSAGKRIADSRIAQLISPFGQTIKERIPVGIKIAREEVVGKRLALRQMSQILERIETGKSFAPQLWRGIKKWFPDEYTQLRAMKTAEPTGISQLRQSLVNTDDILRQQAREIRPTYTQARIRAAQPVLAEESIIMHPAFQGKIYPKAVAGEIAKYWDDMGWSPLNKLATLSGEMRTLVAAADFSAMFIQGLPGIALHPKAWGRAASMSFRAWKSPQRYQEYLVKELDTLMERANYGGYIGGFEFMEAMPALQRTAGFVGGLAGRVPAGRRLGQQAIRQTYGRFEASFGAFGDVMRNEMWKALKGSATNPDDLFEIARHLDRMTGVMSTKGLGLGKTQRDFEQAFLFFAPRYTRAGFSLVADVFKGGLTGNEARKALGSMMAAGAAAYAGTALAMGQEPNFDPTSGKFMTIKITDPVTGSERHFGIGGMMTSLARFAADVTASITGKGQNEPLDFVKMNRFDNPFLKFLFSKSAPLTGFTEGLLFGHNYFGEPFESPKDYGMFMMEQVMPIALQQTLMEEGGVSPTGIFAEELGMRTFPTSDWEKRNIIRDQYSQQEYGLTWQEVGTQMGELYQNQLATKYPELREATEKAQETSSKMARGEGVKWDMWRKESRTIEDTYRNSVMLASQEFEQTKNGYSFRVKVDEARAIRRAMYSQMKLKPEYQEVYQYFDEPLDKSTLDRMNPLDIARREYYNVMYAADMYDQFGNYNWANADLREDQYLAKYGQDALDYIRAYGGAKWDEPPALQALNDARRTLSPYWEISNQVWSKYSSEAQQVSDEAKVLGQTQGTREEKRFLFNHPLGPTILMARREIAMLKKQLRVRSPEIDRLLKMFY